MKIKQHITGLVALIAGLGAVGLHFYQRPAKIAYAETSVLLTEFSEAVLAKKEFEKSQMEWDKNLKSLNDSLTATMERMKLQYDKASKSEKEAIRNSLEKQNSDLQRYSNAVKKLSIEKERELMDPVIKKVNAFIDQWGRSHGYDMILGTMTGGNILQAKGELNVTLVLLKDLNLQYASVPIAGDLQKSSNKSGDSAKENLEAGAKIKGEP